MEYYRNCKNAKIIYDEGYKKEYIFYGKSFFIEKEVLENEYIQQGYPQDIDKFIIEFRNTEFEKQKNQCEYILEDLDPVTIQKLAWKYENALMIMQQCYMNQEEEE